MKKVLVTGGAGNVGSAIVRRLLQDPQWEVRVSDQRTPAQWIADDCEIHTGDLRDLDEARTAIKGCTHLIHLAAIVGGIGNWHKFAHDVIETNTALYNSVFRAALEEDLERTTYASSSMVFENATEFPTTEAHIRDTITPWSAYGFSKLAGEVYCRALADQHGFRYTIVRPFNAYGPGEVPEDEPGITHVIPDLIRKVLSGQKPLQIFGSGEQTRALTYIDDLADGVVIAADHPAAEGEDFNISTPREATVAEMARIVWEACGENPEEFELEHMPTYEVDVQRRVPSVEKARDLLGYEAKIDLEEGIARTVEWLRENMAVQS